MSQTPPASGVSPEAVIQFLQQTIAWYRQLDVQRQLAAGSGDVLVINDNEQIAAQVVWLAFDFARTEAEFISKSAGSKQAKQQTSDSSQYASLFRLSASLDQEVRQTQAEVESLRQKLTSATERQRPALQTQIAETQSELNLAEARRDSLRKMVEFVQGSSVSGLGATGLRENVEALARSVPAALSNPSAARENVASSNAQNYPPAAGTQRPEPTGVWGLTADILALSRKKDALSEAVRLTESLDQESKEFRTPLVNMLREMSRRGDELATQADSAGQTALAQEKKELDALTGQFKQISAAVLPLSKVGILLDLYKKSLTDWQGTIRGQYAAELRNLALRMAVLVLFLAGVIAAAEVWRRTIFRYVRDLRRRHQYLLLRRIVLWCVIAVILVFAFSNELSSVATFAGLMTAGVAVALQNVILSVAGYFFLIGKFGIRVGDRVQVAGVTGEVIDIGLVRFHLLELVSGGGKTPSGRVVAFSNSIVFQATAGVFKQIPGTSFVWHEVSLALPSDSEYRSVEERLRGAVESVFSEYREEMEQQHRELEKTLTAMPVGELRPSSRLRLTQSGIEAVIRYPVDLQHGGDIDDRVTRELLKTIEGEPKLTQPGTPVIKLKTDVSSSSEK